MFRTKFHYPMLSGSSDSPVLQVRTPIMLGLSRDRVTIEGFWIED
jgi:hypothetical protein